MSCLYIFEQTIECHEDLLILLLYRKNQKATSDKWSRKLNARKKGLQLKATVLSSLPPLWLQHPLNKEALCVLAQPHPPQGSRVEHSLSCTLFPKQPFTSPFWWNPVCVHIHKCACMTILTSRKWLEFLAHRKHKVLLVYTVTAFVLFLYLKNIFIRLSWSYVLNSNNFTRDSLSWFCFSSKR